MKRLLLTMVCLFGLFSLNAQNAENLQAVRWVSVTENETSVDVEWNMSFSDSEIEDFELGSFLKKDWKNDGEYPWIITEKAFKGNYAMKSSCEKVNDGVSSIEIEVDVPYDGLLSFNHKVSSEDNADVGNFYIDNVLQTTISGNREWRYVELYVTEGKHTYKWEYTKDYSRHTYADAYFVDDIVFYKELELNNSCWIGYDDDEYATSIGTSSVSPTYWGVSFPVTEPYEGFTLTKIAVYDAEKAGAVNYTANIYLGGDTAPETLVSTKEFSMKGENKMVEVELSTPVAIDGTQSLWITLFCDQSEYPVPACLKSEHLTTDWLSLDGKEWKHSYEYNLNGSWMVRGYLEDMAGNNVRVLASSENEEAVFSSKYNLYRKDLYNNTELLAEKTDLTKYTDNAWSTLGMGAYKWGVAAIYDEDKESEVLWSNTLAKDMSTQVTVKVSTDSEDPVVGAVINFVNKVESEYSYTFTLGIDNTYTISDFRKGVYEVSILKEGFVSDYNGTTMEIWEAKEIECELKEDLAPVSDLYVSPTGWVMWKGANIGAGDEFYFDFEDGTLNGWSTIDADNDNYNWQNSIEIMAPGSGHNSSVACVTSMSWIFGVVLTPDNYLVTEKKYKIDETSKLKFYVCAQDVMAPNDHYGVAVSLNGNTDAEDFITIWEETLSAKSGGTREQGNWYEKVIDLSDFAGMEIYIALRHFNCTDQFYINVDDISLETELKNDRALQAYQVYLDGELVADNLTRTYYQHEDLVDGKEYTTTVVPVYTMGKGEEATYTWNKVACDKFEGVTDLTAKYANGVTTINWTMPETENKTDKTRAGEWLTYDNGKHVDALGISYDGETFDKFQWAVMFPTAKLTQHAGKYLTKVRTYDHAAFDGTAYIYLGGSSAPGTLVSSQDFSCTGAAEYIDIPLTESVEITGNDNVWVVFENKNGEYVASFCDDSNNSNGRWVDMNNGYGWFDIQMIYGPNYGSFQIHAYVTDDKEDDIDLSGVETLGVQLYRNGELVSQLLQGESFVDEKAQLDDEYSLRVVYGGEKDKSYYAMSCHQPIVADLACQAPKNIKAHAMSYPDGRFGTMLYYPYTAPTSEWLHYDDGFLKDVLGGVESFYYGVKFPAEKLEDYAGTNLTKVMFYDYVNEEVNSNDVTIHIYYGGDDAPGMLIHTQQFAGTNSSSFVEVELTSPLPVSGEESIWVILKTDNGMKWPAPVSKDCGDPNARWFSSDGNNWKDIIQFQVEGSFMVRAFVTNERGVAKAVDNSTRGLSFKNYNIYRGSSLNDMELLTTTTEKSYFDEVEKGTYYYQVTAVYEDEGVYCESEPAVSFDDEKQNYVVVEVTSIKENCLVDMKVYPNPTNGNLNIYADAMRRITIANTLGQIVYDSEVGNDRVVVDMAQYKSGVYMIRVTTDNGVAMKYVSVVK